MHDARAAPNPSSAATLPAYQEGQNKKPILNGRPQRNYGPPIGLFHPVFNDFHAAMTSSEPVYTDAEMCSSIKALFEAFADIYDTVAERTTAIDKHLKAILGTPFIVVKAKGVESDGAVVQNYGASVAYLAMR